VTRQTYQQGYVSEPIQTRRGTAFKIRYRVRTLDGGWKQTSEMLYGLPGRTAARSTLGQRIQTASKTVPGMSGLTIREFTESYWKRYLDRKCVKSSTMASYKSALELHILPAFGDCQMSEVVPLQVEHFLQTKLKAGLSPKTARNLLGILQGLFSLAVDNQSCGVSRSPSGHQHKCERFWRVHRISIVCYSKISLSPEPGRAKSLACNGSMSIWRKRSCGSNRASGAAYSLHRKRGTVFAQLT
jgi:hypothetical protein